MISRLFVASLALLAGCSSGGAEWLRMELLPVGPSLTGFCGDGTAFAAGLQLERYSYPDLGRLTGGGSVPASTGQVQCAHSAYLFRSSVGEVRLSQDGGATWTRESSEDGAVTDAVVDPEHVLWRAVVGDDLWIERSDDDGLSWERTSRGLRMPDGGAVSFASFWRGGLPLVLAVRDEAGAEATLVLDRKGRLDRSSPGAPAGSPPEVITRKGRAFSRVPPEGVSAAPVLGSELWSSRADPLSDDPDAWKPVLTMGWRRYDMDSPPPTSLLLDPEDHLVLRRGALLLRSSTSADKNGRAEILRARSCEVLEGQGVEAGGPGAVLLYNDTSGPVRVATLSAQRLLWEHTARTDPETGAPSYSELEAGAELRLTSEAEPVVVVDAAERCLGVLVAGDIGEPVLLPVEAVDTGDTGTPPEPESVPAWWISKLK